MAETFTPWDAAEHLRDKEDMRLYREACAAEDPGDGSLIRAALNDIARAQNMSRLARPVLSWSKGRVSKGCRPFQTGRTTHQGPGLASISSSV